MFSTKPSADTFRIREPYYMSRYAKGLKPDAWQAVTCIVAPEYAEALWNILTEVEAEASAASYYNREDFEALLDRMNAVYPYTADYLGAAVYALEKQTPVIGSHSHRGLFNSSKDAMRFRPAFLAEAIAELKKRAVTIAKP
ncbi:hypothetical protein ACM71H_25875 [Pseudomonas aeruginosa]